jgi:phosphoserine phosphatase
LIGEANIGEAKRRAMATLAAAMQIELRQSHAYGNTTRDVPMLKAVGRAHAVNPGKDLARIANELDWAIWHWHVEKKPASGQLVKEKAKFQMIGTRT